MSGRGSPENSCPPRTFESDLIGNRVFADVIMVRMEMRSHWAPNPMKSVLIGERKEHKHREDNSVQKEADTAVMRTTASQGIQGLLATDRS